MKKIASKLRPSDARFRENRTQNLALVAELIITCASLRKESRGLHFNLDYPSQDDEYWKRDTVIRI